MRPTIGTDRTGEHPLPNGGSGVRVFNVSQENRIGGAMEGEGNLIAFNSGNGVMVDGSFGPAVRNTISRDRIHSNGMKGIALRSGANAGLPVPVIAVVTAGQVSGSACPHCTIEVFSDAADEGAIYEGTSVADAAGNWSLSKPAGFVGPHMTATATDGSGNTSEFSVPAGTPSP